MPLSLSFDSDYVNEFALCDTKSDYFELEFTDASELQIFISADERLEIIYNLLGADNQTIVASGFVGELGAELLRTTIPTATKRLLEVIQGAFPHLQSGCHLMPSVLSQVFRAGLQSLKHIKRFDTSA